MAQPKVKFKNYNRTAPAWAGTPGHQPKVLVPGGGHLASAQFTNSSNAIVVTASANAAANATSITISALTDNNSATPAGTVLIPVGRILDFTGTGKFALLTADAVKGATSLTVEALPQALTSNDVAYHNPNKSRFVQSGILVGRTIAERDASVGYGPADVTTPDDEIHLLYFDVNNVLDDNEAELYMAKAGNVVYENLLPNWTSFTTAQKTWLRANYTCIKGQP